MAEKLRDRKAVVAIAKRLGRAKLGNFGDLEPVGGGDKSSQKKDIKKAKELAKRQQEDTMTLKTTPYNPFDYLETQEEINEYLTDAFQDEDLRLFVVALGYLAKKKGMTEVAKKTGLNRESLYRALSENGNPKFATISKVSKALGCKLAVA